MQRTSPKTEFRMPYVGIDHFHGEALLYGDRGDFSAIFKLRNPVTQYGADPEPYTAYHNLLLNTIKILGEGYIIQKQDVFSRMQFQSEVASEFLQQKYAEHFKGREYTQITTYLTITKLVKRNAFYVHDPKALAEFTQQLDKLFDLMQGAGMMPERLNEKQIHQLVSRILTMDFTSENIVLDNIAAGDTELKLGDRALRNISLINTDVIDLPETVSTYTQRQESRNLRDFPVDNLFFLHHVPDYSCIIYNQLIEIPGQQQTLNKLELKRKRHSGVPDPANLICVEDIDKLLVDVARENQLLVHAHFNILLCADHKKIGKAANFIEASLFQLGIIPSRNAYNQLELFRTALPGNGVEIKKYDWFLTTSDAAICLLFKEALQTEENSDFLIRFTDRQGIPIGIDPADVPMRTGRINNRSKFTLGPSGSGKSFFMNALVEQYCRYNMDVVIVDTGDSYSGLCSYYKGKYITYTEEKPISMNPFALSRKEFNLEKKDFLKTLIALLWKGADGQLTQIEDTVLSNVLSSYYYEHFWLDPGEQNPKRPEKLDFDSFYTYSVDRIRNITEQESISFDLDEYRYVLRKFHTGQEFGTVLNETADSSLFTEKFIVFEIDNLKENKVLFPIVTLIIMDVFLQKMRHRKDRRKALIVEEAWKAIASPLMASYLLYLYKTVRKFWGEVVVVTQELGDILGNPIVKDSILANSDTICLLDQSKFRENYDAIAKLLSITETEQRKIFTINQLENKEKRGRFKEVYIRRGTTGEVYGVEVSIYQYLCYTTEKPEKSAVESYVRKQGNYRDGLTAFVEDLKSSGLQLGEFVTQVNKASL
ncbi:TraG family conjugative transposon ATPase [Sphingobacterium bovistauri]|uniref:TraG family conjugative transposon ATPase n=1 Tax=Sphingobacterium bovistauri TaxID=2781959 RepID=A0ABS7ZB87_9SPHI|nr:TraG family conjugative transposon ATPase [Sphingobacterium bovistauri]MCA5006145.1 TraG family conjugative transposon ATPase [Sphingobacterium bovistauri]